jgi:hypothetical protein
VENREENKQMVPLGYETNVCYKTNVFNPQNEKLVGNFQPNDMLISLPEDATVNPLGPVKDFALL